MAPTISLDVAMGPLVSQTEEVVPSFIVYPQFWKLLSICRTLLCGPRLLGPQPMSSDVVPYQLPVHHVFQFAMLASALIWAKENWVSQQVISVQPIQAIHPQHTVSVLDLLLDPFQQDVSPALPPRPKRRTGKLILLDSEIRRSERINKLSNGFMSPDPNLGVGKPRGKARAKSSKKLKMLAQESGILLSLSTLCLWNLMIVLLKMMRLMPPADCSIQLQQIGTDVCGMSREIVSAEALTAHAGNGSHRAAAP